MIVTFLTYLLYLTDLNCFLFSYYIVTLVSIRKKTNAFLYQEILILQFAVGRKLFHACLN